MRVAMLDQDENIIQFADLPNMRAVKFEAARLGCTYIDISKRNISKDLGPDDFRVRKGKFRRKVSAKKKARQARWRAAKHERNQRLNDADIAVKVRRDAAILAGNKFDETPWAQYRRSLRDLQYKVDDPETIDWPSQPA